MMSIFSLITIRKGSEGLKDKCLRKINNKAVFEYTIEYSLDLNRRLDEEVFTAVSSDSERIREYCVANNICFLERSPVLASNTARIDDVIYDAYRQVGKDFDYISLLYGNIPTRYPEEFVRAYEFLVEDKDYDCVMSMHNVEKFNTAWMFDLDENTLPAKREEGFRRQDLTPLMIHDGHTTLFRNQHFLEFKESKSKANFLYEYFGRKIKPMLNDKLIIDIDTEKDLELAGAVFKFRGLSANES